MTQAIQRTEEIDAALLRCKLLAVEALLSLASALLLFILASTRTLGALATLCIAFFSFLLWCFSVWGKGTEALLTLVASAQQSLKSVR